MGFNIEVLNRAVTSMSQNYSDAQASLATSLERIATSKRFQYASEDLSSFIKISTYEITSASYSSMQRNIDETRVNVTSMQDAANNIMDQLAQAKQFFANGSDDSARIVVDGLKNQLNAVVHAGYKIIGGAGASPLNGVGGAITIDLSTNLTIANIIGGGAHALGTFQTDATTTQTTIDDMKVYIGTLQGLGKQLEYQSKLAGLLKSNADALISVVTEIDEVKEIANVTDKTIRMDASMSMIAQANLMRESISLLYEQ